MRKHFLAALAVAILACGASAQDPRPLARAELDKRARKIAYETVEVGVGLFNAGERSPTPLVNYEGTARLYEGTLMALVQMLDHRPDTVKVIQAKLELSRLQQKPQDRAFVLREALDEVMKVGAKKIALWERLGGEAGVKAVAKEFIATTLKNPKANFLRDGKFKGDGTWVAEQERLLVEMISAATGGPLKYTGRDMKTVHAGMKITEDEFGEMVADMAATLKKFNVPRAESDELMAIVAATKPFIVEGKK